MSIRIKIILTVLPLLIVTLLLSSIASSFSARSGITRIGVEFLGFKAQELKKYANNQWSLLIANKLVDRVEYVNAAKKAVVSFTETLVRSDTELIFALDSAGKVVLETRTMELDEDERVKLQGAVLDRRDGWLELRVENRERVGHSFFFDPFNWYFFVTEEKSAFYREVKEITTQSIIILIISCVVSLILLLFFSSYLTKPLTKMAAAMKNIIAYNDLSARVAVKYKDETGELAHTFNIMTGELEKAYNEIKNFAFKAVLSRKREHEIRNIFQKYVPKDVIDKIFENPESMLVGENRILAVLFSDIRSFTAISEGLKPDDLVSSLNRYFSIMVDIIINHKGIVDKYIGDAIMAFFGAPVRHDNDALQAVFSSLEMNEALAIFNQEQERLGKPQFRIGVGISYGDVTVGNIGSEKKMDYTVIGDMVNLASRLENLTKFYKQGLIFSENVYKKVENVLPCRLLDKVIVKGRTYSESIYTAKRKLDEKEGQAWSDHHTAMNLYYKKEFPEAGNYFFKIQKLLPGDPVSSIFIERCNAFSKNPPPSDWNGVEVMQEK